jgi:YidC/Oxa1 family membrane protein insertase
MMPLIAKQQKSMRQMQKVQPLLEKAQKKYANDKQKLQQETVKIYQENNVSPAGGCLPLLIQFPILIGLYRVIQRPLTYIRGINFADSQVVENVKLVIEQMKESFPDVIGNLANVTVDQINKIYQIQLSNWSELVGKAQELSWDINFNFLGLDLSK